MRSHFAHEIPFMKHRRKLLSVSATLVILAIVGLLPRGLVFGIEFQGGMETWASRRFIPLIKERLSREEGYLC